MTRRALDVELYGMHIAWLSKLGHFRLHLNFTKKALNFFGEVSRVLSLALPISQRPVHDACGATGAQDIKILSVHRKSFPEDNLRRHLISAAGISVTDTMCILASVDEECVGTIQLFTDSVTPDAGRVCRLKQVGGDRTGSEITYLPTNFPTGATPQVSLASFQGKVLS
ncbi:HipA N-terminal domain-containing protein [Mycobacterium leprae]|nr:HipA N-terminal domain-containing protein [Mycobacterium leprae]OAR19775.1 hypothetical protein A8144_03710 [Mycobacterium leprae 3125609]OAX71890.1 hypothetical protein A3216_02755 [Mycobacterium leprae 7935681]